MELSLNCNTKKNDSEQFSKIDYRATGAFLGIILYMHISTVYSIQCWNCGYAEDQMGNRIPIPIMFQDKSVSFCGDFVSETTNKNSTKDYPKVNIIIQIHWNAKQNYWTK